MNILLLIYDCLRLDYWENRMPLSRAIVQQWFTEYKNHWAVAHCSDPNYFTMLTGAPPWVSGVTTQMGVHFDAVPQSILSALLKRQGYTTWAVEPVQTPKFYKAFDAVAWQRTEQSADLSLQAIDHYVTEAGDQPWFGFIRDMTCHYPYHDQPMPERGKEAEIRPLYEQAVDHVDAHFAAVFDYVQKHAPNTLILVGADHGEMLGEHGLYDHLFTLYNYLTHVPFAVKLPAQTEGAVVNTLTQHIDIYPTILRMLDIPHKNRFGGEDLRTPPARRTLFFQSTGAGPLKPTPQEQSWMIDPEGSRILWRHRGMLTPTRKIVQNLHYSGTRETLVTNPADYEEKAPKSYIPNQVRRQLDFIPFPDYHPWERLALEQDTIPEADRKILDRLKALGYA